MVANDSALFLYIYNIFNTLIPTTYSSNFITHPRILYFTITTPHRRYPYFDVVVGLAWSNDPEGYAGSSKATGRAPHAREVKVGYGIPWSSRLGDEREADNPTP